MRTGHPLHHTRSCAGINCTPLPRSRSCTAPCRPPPALHTARALREKAPRKTLPSCALGNADLLRGEPRPRQPGARACRNGWPAWPR
eukprot:scaffold38142_cov27-Tisochrysis_lutea.AAC.2